MRQSPQTRLYAILARDADRGVLFRRGPSKRVLLIVWDTANDTFEEGQWLKGRIYERRGDLSPDGQLLVYFAASQKKPYFSWTAISRPPFLTALALWPKGDAWGGGGLFRSPTELALNHHAGQMDLAPDFTLPRSLNVTTLGTRLGEDDPIWSMRLTRDGWVLVSGGRQSDKPAPVWIAFDPPIIWEKHHPVEPGRYTLRMSIHGVKEKDGPWYVIEHAISAANEPGCDIGRSDWADWARNGDLLFTQNGRVFRCVYSADGLGAARELADFSDRRFAERTAPPAALRWSK